MKTRALRRRYGHAGARTYSLAEIRSGTGWPRGALFRAGGSRAGWPRVYTLAEIRNGTGWPTGMRFVRAA